MFLKQLSLINYKNFDDVQFDFDKKINCIVGNNGVGKTNILDAVYHLAFGKSYFNMLSQNNIRHHQNFYVIDGKFKKNHTNEHIICSLKKGQKKVINHNGKVHKRLSDHIGLLSAVIISPTDRDIINERSNIRRKFIDNILCQYDKTYLQYLLAYNKALEQRNALLKLFAANQTFDKETLELYDTEIIPKGTYIHERRKKFIDEFRPIFQKTYNLIATPKESINISYKSDLTNCSMTRLLSEALNRDRMTHSTNKGIHKDDLGFTINDYPIKKFGSQGQQKSLLIALKLAQFDYIKHHCLHTPILLLDDIFDKLDEQRVRSLIALVNTKDFGQIFISDTYHDRTEKSVKVTGQSYKIIQL